MKYPRVAVAAACMLSASPALGASFRCNAGEERNESSAAQDIVVTGSLIRGLPREYIRKPGLHLRQERCRAIGLELDVRIYSHHSAEFRVGPQRLRRPRQPASGPRSAPRHHHNQFDAFSAFALRGLASDATLTLLNGRRMPSVGMVEGVDRLGHPLGADRAHRLSSPTAPRRPMVPTPSPAWSMACDPQALEAEGVELRARGGGHDAQRVRRAGMPVRSRRRVGAAAASMAWRATSAATSLSATPSSPARRRSRSASCRRRDLSGFYLASGRKAGDIALSLDISRFRRDRRPARA